MIVTFETRWIKTLRYKNKGKKSEIAIVRCDVCHFEFETSAFHAKKLKCHLCSDECSSQARSVGGVLYEQITSTNIKKYGKKFASQTQEIKSKQQLTNLDRYGAKATSMNSKVEEKRRQTCFLKYGGPAATSSPTIADKVRQKLKSTSIFVMPELRAKFNQIMIERHGAPWAAQAKLIREKQIKTCLTKFGVASPLNTNKAIEAAHTPEAQQRRLQSLKRNKTYGTSKPEAELGSVLRKLFGDENIFDQYVVNSKWPIDFYIKNIDVYVQYDSYWHGVGRSIEEVSEHKCPRDVTIHKKMLIDKEQNEWFISQNKKLVRIVNDEYRNIDLILSKLKEI